VEDLKSFANYGFPESHAWSFALIAYATGWLKAHYTEEFFAALLNSWPMGFYAPSTLIHDARRHGVVVRPPCMRDGEWECTVEPIEGAVALRIGWRHIRGLGEKTLDALRLARGGKAAIGVGSSIGKSRSRRPRKAATLETLTREAMEAGELLPDRPFTSIEDVVLRGKLRRDDVLQLARAGAFAVWEPDRRRAGWEGLRAVGDSLPLAPGRHAMHNPRPLSETELIYLDYFATGVSIHGHPLQHMRERLRNAGVVDSEGLKKLQGGERILVAGLVTIRQRPASANGTIFLLLEDEWGFINIVVPSFLVEKYSEVVKFATFVVVQGRFEKDGNVLNVIGQRFRELNVRHLEHQARSFR
jgi:error-prone DNA polymerase